MFETTVEASWWLVAEWAIPVLPLLTGEAQATALALPEAAHVSFPQLQQAILDRMGYSPEDYRRWFRSNVLGPADHPFVYAQCLKDTAIR